MLTLSVFATLSDDRKLKSYTTKFNGRAAFVASTTAFRVLYHGTYGGDDGITVGAREMILRHTVVYIPGMEGAIGRVLSHSVMMYLAVFGFQRFGQPLFIFASSS